MNLLKDVWYCAGWSTDVAEEPVHRKILGEDLVLFRDSKGKVQAISDKCPHRFAPLHQGKVMGDAIACPYHGLRFDGTGTCVLNPHGSGQVPPGPHVAAYPLEERNGTLWIWMGDKAKADPDQIIDTGFMLDRQNFNGLVDHHVIAGNYMLVVDNLLDLTHAQFLHPETVFGIASHDRWHVNLDGGPKAGEEELQEVWFEESPDSLTVHQVMREKKQPPLWDPIVNYGDDTTVTSHITWFAPSNMDLTIELDGKTADKPMATMRVMHFMTPIDELSCYYFVGVFWDTNIHDEAAVDGVRAIVLQTLSEEDGPMIEKCQTYMGETTDLFSLRPLLLQTDGIAIKARRRMDKILAAAQAADSANTDTPSEVATAVAAE